MVGARVKRRDGGGSEHAMKSGVDAGRLDDGEGLDAVALTGDRNGAGGQRFEQKVVEADEHGMDVPVARWQSLQKAGDVGVEAEVTEEARRQRERPVKYREEPEPILPIV